MTSLADLILNLNRAIGFSELLILEDFMTYEKREVRKPGLSPCRPLRAVIFVMIAFKSYQRLIYI